MVALPVGSRLPSFLLRLGAVPPTAATAPCLACAGVAATDRASRAASPLPPRFVYPLRATKPTPSELSFPINGRPGPTRAPALRYSSFANNRQDQANLLRPPTLVAKSACAPGASRQSGWLRCGGRRVEEGRPLLGSAAFATLLSVPSAAPGSHVPAKAVRSFKSGNLIFTLAGMTL